MAWDRRQRGICQRCGEHHTAVQVGGWARERNDGSGQRHLASISGSFCDDCSQIVFEEVKTVIVNAKEGGRV